MSLFDIKTIMEYVPHRYPFLLIDRVLEFEEHTRVVTRKNVTINEAQFQGHFPGEPVFPGVYIIENMAQSACFLLAKSVGSLDTTKVYYLGKVQKISFRKPVVPGDTMETEVTIIKSIGGMAMVEAKVMVDGKVVAKGEMAFSAA